MKNVLAAVDWSKVFSYGYHIALLAGSVALTAYAPQQAIVWGPVLQALGQASPKPEGMTLLNSGSK